jgi:hypothetical protein
VSEGFDVAEVVGRDDLDPRRLVRVHRAPEVPPDPAEPVDSYPDTHVKLLFALSGSLITYHAHHNTGP